jgi:hypothetical protein
MKENIIPVLLEPLDGGLGNRMVETAAIRMGEND